jgi:hypothetical protein
MFIVFLIAAAAVLYSILRKPTRTQTAGVTTNQMAGMPSTSTPYETPRQYGPTLEQLGADKQKPALLILGNSPTTGYVQWYSKYATMVAGISTENSVLFSVAASDNGAHYDATRVLDHVNVSGDGGTIVVQVQHYTTYATQPSGTINETVVPPNSIDTTLYPWPATDTIPPSYPDENPPGALYA